MLLPRRTMKPRFNKHFDNLRTRGGPPRRSLSSRRKVRDHRAFCPRVSIAVSRVPSVRRLGARVFLAADSTSSTRLRLALQLSSRWQSLRLISSCWLAGDIEHFPADLLNRCAARMKPVFHGTPDQSNDRSHRPRCGPHASRRADAGKPGRTVSVRLSSKSRHSPPMRRWE